MGSNEAGLTGNSSNGLGRMSWLGSFNRGFEALILVLCGDTSLMNAGAPKGCIRAYLASSETAGIIFNCETDRQAEGLIRTEIKTR
jgi:hypothetical protein